MNVNVNANDLKHMMKVATMCVDQKVGVYTNVRLTADNDGLSVTAMNHTTMVRMTAPAMVDEEADIMVDCKLLSDIVSKSRGDCKITSDGKFCTVKSIGKSRLLLMPGEFPEASVKPLSTITVEADKLLRAFERTDYAIATDESRPILTGLLFENINGTLHFVALNGFELAVESAECMGGDMKMVVPGSIIRLLRAYLGGNEEVTIFTDGARVCFQTKAFELIGTLLQGEYVDYNKIIPVSFTTESRLNVKEIKDMLSSSKIMTAHNHLIKLEVYPDEIMLKANSESADFEGSIQSYGHGSELKIAFNIDYLIQALSVITTDECIIRFNTSVSPAVISEPGSEGIHLLLPVRVM